MPCYRLLITDKTGIPFFFHEFSPLPKRKLKKVIHDETTAEAGLYQPTLESGFLAAVAGIAGTQGFNFNSLEYSARVVKPETGQSRNVIFSIDCDVFTSEPNIHARIHRCLDQILFKGRTGLENPNSFSDPEQQQLKNAFNEGEFQQRIFDKTEELSKSLSEFFAVHEEFRTPGVGFLSASYSVLLYLPATAYGRELPPNVPQAMGEFNEFLTELGRLPPVDPGNTNFIWAPDYHLGLCLRNLGVGPQILGQLEPFYLCALIEPGFLSYKVLDDLAVKITQILV